MQTVLVSGGAGYVGSHACLRLAEAGFRVDYVALRNAQTLAPVVDSDAEPLRLLAAAWLGKTRLIDNVPV